MSGKRVGLFIHPTDLLAIQKLPEGTTDEQGLEAIGLSGLVTALDEAGADIVIVLGTNLPNLGEQVLVVGNNGLRIGFGTYVAATDPDGPIASIADVIAFNDQDPQAYAFHGQEMLQTAADSSLSPDEYITAGAALRLTARDYIDGLFRDDDLDALASRRNDFSTYYAVAGYPAITVPAGLDATGLPLGLTFSGRLLEDGEIIGLAYAYEQATQQRQVPQVGAVD